MGVRGDGGREEAHRDHQPGSREHKVPARIPDPGQRGRFVWLRVVVVVVVMLFAVDFI